MICRGTNGGTQDAKDATFFFAKTVDKIAPVTLGVANATITAAPIITNHLIGQTHIESSDFGSAAFDYIAMAATGGGGANNHVPNIVLQGEPESGENVGFDTLYIGAAAGNSSSFDFGTTVITRGAITDDTTTVVPTDKGSDDDPNADLIFAVGDVIHTGTDDVVGIVSSIAAFGSSKQDITFTAGITADLADNEELFNINPIRIILSFEK